MNQGHIYLVIITPDGTGVALLYPFSQTQRILLNGNEFAETR
jgi:hypothetical protein